MRIFDHVVIRRVAVGALGASIIAIATGGSCTTNNTLPIFGPVVLNPSSITFPQPTPAPQTFSASQSNFSGTFTAVSADTTVATVAATSPPNTFVVTAGTNHSTTTITVTGGGGSTGTVSVDNRLPVCVRHRDMWQEQP